MWFLLCPEILTCESIEKSFTEIAVPMIIVEGTQERILMKILWRQEIEDKRKSQTGGEQGMSKKVKVGSSFQEREAVFRGKD